MSGDAVLADGHAALIDGRWADAQEAFATALVDGDSPEARFGLASALWWLGESQRCVDECARAYRLFRRRGDAVDAAQCAV
jgi:uncharacterized protein HemY